MLSYSIIHTWLYFEFEENLFSDVLVMRFIDTTGFHYPREINLFHSAFQPLQRPNFLYLLNQAKVFFLFYYWVQLFSRHLNNLVWTEAGLNGMAFLLSWLLCTYLESLNWKQFTIWTKKFPIQFCKWKHNQRESCFLLHLLLFCFCLKSDCLLKSEMFFFALLGSSKKWLQSYLFPISNLFNFSKKRNIHFDKKTE